MKEPFVDTQTKTLSENYMGPFPTFDDEGRNMVGNRLAR